jgi:hypothetical protein
MVVIGEAMACTISEARPQCMRGQQKVSVCLCASVCPCACVACVPTCVCACLHPCDCLCEPVGTKQRPHYRPNQNGIRKSRPSRSGIGMGCTSHKSMSIGMHCPSQRTIKMQCLGPSGSGRYCPQARRAFPGSCAPTPKLCYASSTPDAPWAAASFGSTPERHRESGHTCRAPSASLACSFRVLPVEVGLPRDDYP